MRVLECREISVTASGGSEALLRGISAHFGPGINLIMGETGAGKTTLLQILAGLRRPSSGEVLASGAPISRWVTRHRDLWRRSVGMAFQHTHLIPELTALENVMAPLSPRGLTLARIEALSWEALLQLEAETLVGRQAFRLSGGERQRVGLARAIVGQPEYLLADEPTAHQDVHGFGLVVASLERLATGGSVVVVASHDPRLLERSDFLTRFRLTAGRLSQE